MGKSFVLIWVRQDGQTGLWISASSKHLKQNICPQGVGDGFIIISKHTGHVKSLFRFCDIFSEINALNS